ncbi:MAG: DUF4212 domain-containing protein [Pseudomonadota bacterium]
MTREAFWRAHLRLIGWCLLVWFVASFGCGILFADALNRLQIGGVPLGFWFAQQGAIYVFVVLIPIYTWRINRLERRYHAGATERSSDSDGGA